MITEGMDSRGGAAMEQPRVRIRDIAEELGLSTATVSNVIHGKTGKVSEATIRRVMELVEQRQYIPNMAGILLARNASGIIGVFIHDHEKYGGHTLEDSFLAAALNDLAAEIQRRGLFLMVKLAKNAREIIQFSSMWNMEGLVVLGFCDRDYMELRRQIRIPFVVYDGSCENQERIVSLTLDDYGGGVQMGQHLRALGHTAALCLADNEVGVDLQRMEGFAAGFAPGQVERLIVPMQEQKRRLFYEQQMARLLSVTAVFAVSDHYAIELMAFLHSRGIAVPERLSVCGFDDIPLCRMVWPTLTTIRQDNARRAALALEQLEALRTAQTTAPILRLPVTLVVRESTGRV